MPQMPMSFSQRYCPKLLSILRILRPGYPRSPWPRSSTRKSRMLGRSFSAKVLLVQQKRNRREASIHISSLLEFCWRGSQLSNAGLFLDLYLWNHAVNECLCRHHTGWFVHYRIEKGQQANQRLLRFSSGWLIGFFHFFTEQGWDGLRSHPV